MFTRYDITEYALKIKKNMLFYLKKKSTEYVNYI